MTPISNPIRGLLRLEAFTVFASGLVIWTALDGGWLRFFLLFLIPDLSIAAYLLGPRVGAVVYNAAHVYVVPVALGLAGGMFDNRLLLLTSTLWLTHIGFDRMLGLGLKFPSGFRDTHLGQLGAAPLTELSRPGTYSSAGIP